MRLSAWQINEPTVTDAKGISSLQHFLNMNTIVNDIFLIYIII